MTRRDREEQNNLVQSLILGGEVPKAAKRLRATLN